jgi:hypothetical protein
MCGIKRAGGNLPDLLTGPEPRAARDAEALNQFLGIGATSLDLAYGQRACAYSVFDTLAHERNFLW